MTTPYIDADQRAICERFWTQKVQARFGLTPPTPEEELALIDEFLAAGVPTVPLMHGGEATITGGDASAGLDFPTSPPSGTPKPSGARRPGAGGMGGAKVPPLKLIAGIVMIGAALLVLIGPAVFQPRAPRPETSENGELGEPLLPSGVDALISSGEVRLSTSTVVPNTLEILPADGEPGTTFVVVPVNVRLAEWPCPVDAFEGQPGACWIAGTVVNYLIGLPYNTHTAELAARLHLHGGSVRLRLSTERTILFQVEDVLTVARQQTEVLTQRRFAVTIPLLHAGGTQRTVIVAPYDPAPDLGGLPPQVGEAAGPEVGLGETVSMGVLEVLPIGIHRADAETRVTLAVWNHGTTPEQTLQSAEWQARARLRDGALVDARVTAITLAPGNRAEVVLSAPGPGVAWQVTLPEGNLTISTP